MPASTSASASSAVTPSWSSRRSKLCSSVLMAVSMPDSVTTSTREIVTLADSTRSNGKGASVSSTVNVPTSPSGPVAAESQPLTRKAPSTKAASTNTTFRILPPPSPSLHDSTVDVLSIASSSPMSDRARRPDLASAFSRVTVRWDETAAESLQRPPASPDAR